MAYASSGTKPRDYTDDVRKVHRIAKKRGNEVRSYDYLVDTYDNLTMVTGILPNDDKKTTSYKTSHGKLILDNDAIVKVKDGEIYTAYAGVAIWNFIRGLLVVVQDVKGISIQAVFNDVEFKVYKDDTEADIENRYEERRELIRTGVIQPYNS